MLNLIFFILLKQAVQLVINRPWLFCTPLGDQDDGSNSDRDPSHPSCHQSLSSSPPVSFVTWYSLSPTFFCQAVMEPTESRPFSVWSSRALYVRQKIGGKLIWESLLFCLCSSGPYLARYVCLRKVSGWREWSSRKRRSCVQVCQRFKENCATLCPKYEEDLSI